MKVSGADLGAETEAGVPLRQHRALERSARLQHPRDLVDCGRNDRRVAVIEDVEGEYVIEALVGEGEGGHRRFPDVDCEAFGVGLPPDLGKAGLGEVDRARREAEAGEEERVAADAAAEVERGDRAGARRDAGRRLDDVRFRGKPVGAAGLGGPFPVPFAVSGVGSHRVFLSFPR